MSLSGIPAASHDAISAVYSDFPTMIAVTCSIVFLFLGFSFRSVLLPLRSLFTIAMTLIFVFGVQDAVYQYGILDWMKFDGVRGDGAVVWLPPVLCFSVIVGIGLDYDIFLLVRISEFRKKGLSNDDAIVRGIYKTGHIITAAGALPLRVRCACVRCACVRCAL